MKWLTGSFLIIPQANILATQLELRYPALKIMVFIMMLNIRILIALPEKNINNRTNCLANCSVITEFNPEYIIDLHESRASYTSGYLEIDYLYKFKTALFA